MIIYIHITYLILGSDPHIHLWSKPDPNASQNYNEIGIDPKKMVQKKTLATITQQTYVSNTINHIIGKIIVIIVRNNNEFRRRL